MSRIEAHINEKLAPFKEKRFLLACSGGLDSMVLAELLLRAGIAFELAHVNYNLRGADSDADENFVRNFAATYRLAVHVKNIASGSLKTNVQAEARALRYTWFEEVLNAQQLDFLLLAHHADDQIETFYLNLARDAGVMGLACMPFQRGTLLRPLLEIEKEEILTFAQTCGLAWREDASNASLKYARNRLRNEFLPQLFAALPTLKTSVFTLIQTFQEAQNQLEEKMQAYAERWSRTGTLQITDWQALNALEKVELLRQLGQVPSLLRHLEQLTNSQRGSMAPVRKNRLCAYTHLVREANHFRFTNLQGAGKKKGLVCTPVTTLPTTFDKHAIYLDPAKVKGTLRLRPWREGDRIASLGVPGTQLIGDIISDARIPLEEKAEILVVHDDVHIHWCPGLKIGRLALASDPHSEILHCTILTEALLQSDDLSGLPDSED